MVGFVVAGGFGVVFEGFTGTVPATGCGGGGVGGLGEPFGFEF